MSSTRDESKEECRRTQYMTLKRDDYTHVQDCIQVMLDNISGGIVPPYTLQNVKDDLEELLANLQEMDRYKGDSGNANEEDDDEADEVDKEDG